MAPSLARVVPSGTRARPTIPAARLSVSGKRPRENGHAGPQRSSAAAARGMHHNQPMTTRAAYVPLTAGDFASAFPQSRKVYVDGPSGVRVPMREIVLSNGETLRVYDASGPGVTDVRAGIARVRAAWVAPRKGPHHGGRRVTQLHYARK